MQKAKTTSVEFNGDKNFSSYSDVEKLSRFTTQEALNKYRLERLQTYDQAVAFLQREIPQFPYDIIEIGSGSSALLYSMEKKGLLHSALGIEIAKSRNEFAERWRTDEGYQKVKNWLGNFIDFPFTPKSLNLFLIINETLTYLEPEDPDYISRLFLLAKQSLRENGRLVIEVSNGDSEEFKKLKRERSRNFKKEMPETNVFRYAIYQEDYDQKTNRVRSEATYYSRSGEVTQKSDIAFLFTLAELRQRLALAGFEIEKVFGGMDGSPWEPASSESILVIAKSS